MKKIVTMLLALVLLLALTACGEPAATTGAQAPSTAAPTQPTAAPTEPTILPEEPTTPPTEPVTPPTEPVTPPTEPATPPATEPVHVHTYGPWEVDKDSHWQLCTDCGDISEGKHSANNDRGLCKTCGAEIWEDYDGSVVVEMYDEHDNCTLYQQYDVDGSLLHDSVYEHTYNEAGHILSTKEYYFGELFCESEYTYISEDEYYTSKDTTYWEDGTKEYCEYDTFGSPVVDIIYDTDGQVLYNGRYAYTYDDNGNVLVQENYEDDVLVSKYEYAVYEEADDYYTYLAKETTYNADGSYVVVEYDENYNIISESYFDADGNPVDSTSKFDAALCAPLFGTWQGEYLLDGALMGVTTDIRMEITTTFNDQGEMVTKMVMNREDMKAATMESMYLAYEAYGMSKAEIDAMFLSQIGMSVSDYVDAYLDTDEAKAQLSQEAIQVYYVEGDQIYAGDSWTSYMEPAQFKLEGETLTLASYDEDMGEITYVLTKVVA